jgi:tetratricopeptide (TPR) repeat protein
MAAIAHWRVGQAAAALLLGAMSAFGADKAAEVVNVEGVGEAQTGGLAAWRPARSAMALYPDDSVRTGALSRMGLLFVDRTQVRLAEKTLMRLKATGQGPGQQGRAVLRLEQGRTWAQTNAPSDLHIETPSATAAIRGTDWEIEALPDGQSVLTVFSGEVEFFNDFGRVMVGRNEQARARPGQAPVKVLIANPKDRVQWVTAFSADPLRHIELAGALAAISPRLAAAGKAADEGRWPVATTEFEAVAKERPDDAVARACLALARIRAGRVEEAERLLGAVEPALGGPAGEVDRLARIASLVTAGRLEEAYLATQRATAAGGAAQPAAWLVASDLMVQQGRLERAAEEAKAGLSAFPGHPKLVAQLARISLAAGRFDEAQGQLAPLLAAAQPPFEARLAAADAARARGEEAPARAGYEAARALRPADDRPWFGLGVVDSERENVRDARASLAEAIARNPGGAGYLGELGTLESFAGEFAAAEAAFKGALERNPADYVALTGLGVLQLKRGQTAEALDSFLRASLLEPRYARAHVYAATAHYREGHPEQALAALAKASEADERDPLPHLLASMIQTDLFRAADAIESARIAMRLMPYLKSLNQVANDRQGSANLGRSLTFLGLEDWARTRAQESYLPYWGGSHFFLSDRYPGDYNRNSELLQGFTVDPTVFGSSNRFQTLVSQPGAYGRLLYGYSTGDDLRAGLPVVRLNGMAAEPVPAAFLVDVDQPRFDFRQGTTGQSDGLGVTAAFGMRPTHELGIFAYGFRQRSDGDTVSPTALGDLTLVDSQKTELANAGFSYRLGPQSQLWARASVVLGRETARGAFGDQPIESILSSRMPEYSLRHTFDAGRHQVAWGAEYAHKQANNDWMTGSDIPDFFFVNNDTYDERSRGLYLSDTIDVTPDLLLQVDAWWQETLRTRTGDASFGIPGEFTIPLGAVVEERKFRKVVPRLGLRYRAGEGVLLRAAWQDWSRPVGLSTLSPVATAGIPLDDRVVSRGGRIKRFRGQLEVEASPRAFWAVHAEHKQIENEPFSLSPFIVTEDENLSKLRDFDFGRLGAGDLYEFIRVPEFDAGRIVLGGVAGNAIVAGTVGVTGRYINTYSENTGARYAGNRIAYHPRHTFSVGLTWASPARLFLSSRAVYRSQRYTDEANLSVYRAGWDVAADFFWESADKRARVRVGIDNALHHERQTQYSTTIVLNF